MSRIGNAFVPVPAGVEVKVEGNKVEVTGPKGKLDILCLPVVSVNAEEGKVIIKRKNEDRQSKAVHGLTRSLINNMVIGVSQGWSKALEMVGVGYRVQGGGDTLTLAVGFSHPVVIKAPEGIQFNVADNTKITVSGSDKILVGQIAANIRAVKPPEPYKGKGIRYANEYVKRKAGKAGKAVGVK